MLSGVPGQDLHRPTGARQAGHLAARSPAQDLPRELRRQQARKERGAHRAALEPGSSDRTSGHGKSVQVFSARVASGRNHTETNLRTILAIHLSFEPLNPTVEYGENGNG